MRGLSAKSPAWATVLHVYLVKLRSRAGNFANKLSILIKQMKEPKYESQFPLISEQLCDMCGEFKKVWLINGLQEDDLYHYLCEACLLSLCKGDITLFGVCKGCDCLTADNANLYRANTLQWLQKRNCSNCRYFLKIDDMFDEAQRKIKEIVKEPKKQLPKTKKNGKPNKIVHSKSKK